MPDDPLLSGYAALGAARKRQQSDAAQFVQRQTTYNAFAPWTGNTDPYQQLLPTAADVRGEVAEQRADKPWYVDAFDFLDQLTGGQAIRGFIQGLAPGGPGPFEQFFKHLPLIHYASGEDVMAADIREAWGDTNAREGVKNAVINTIIDIVSNPLLLAANPFAITKVGQAAAAAAGVSRAGAATRGVLSAATMNAEAKALEAGLFSIGKGLETGQRATVVFKLFGKELFTLGQTPVGVNPHGWRSMYVATGNLLDSFFSVLHSHPLLKPVAGVFTFATGIADPRKRALFGAATKAAETARAASIQNLTSILEASTPARVREFVINDTGVHDVILHAAQVGYHDLDKRAGLLESMMEPHLWIGRGKVQDLLKKDAHFANLWTKAWDEVGRSGGRENVTAMGAGHKTDAIRELYEKYSVPLDPAMLAHADLPGRYGVEFSEFDRVSQYEAIRGAEGLAEDASAEARAAIGLAAREKIQAVRAGVQQKIVTSYDKLTSAVNRGEVTWDEIKRYGTNHMNAMEAASEMDRLGGVFGTTMEPAVGPYIHRMADPRALKVLDRQLFKGAEAFGGRKAMNIVDGYMRQQNYASLTTLEANAMFWELGTKLTAFKPLKDIVAADAAAPGLVDQVMAKIYDLPFVRTLRRSKVPGDQELANLFITNPVLNDYDRIWQAGHQFGGRAAMNTIFRGPIPVDEIDLGKDYKKALDYDGDGMHRVIIPNPEPGKMLESMDVGTLSMDILGLERSAAHSLARKKIRAHMKGQITEKGSTYVEQERHLRSATTLDPFRSAEGELIESTADNYGVAITKKSVRDLRDSTIRSRSLDLIQNPKAARTDTGTFKYAEPPDETILQELESLEAQWGSVGLKEQAGIQQRIVATRAKLAELDKWDAELAAELKLHKSSAKDPELRSWQRADGWDFAVERGRNRQLQNELRGVLKDNEAMLAGKYKDKDSFIKETIPERIKFEKDLQADLNGRIRRMKADLTAEADAIAESVDTISGQAKLQGKASLKDLRDARGRHRTAMDMNTEIAIIHEAKERGALALDELPVAKREKLLSRLGTKAYVFKKDDWAAVEAFNAHWNHADDWGQNRIVGALRTIKSIWAPYTAVNGLGLMPRVRDAVSTHLAFEFGGAWQGTMSRMRSYKHSHALASGLRKAIDNPGVGIENYAKGVFKTKAGVEYSYPELIQYFQSHGIAGSPGLAGEMVQHGGDLMEFSRKFKKAGEFAEPGKFAGRQTSIPAAITDFPSAILPLRKAQDSVYGRWGLQMAQFVDDRPRIAAFLGKLDQGSTIDEAADFVTKWGYDSRRNMTTLERQRIATFIPFYSWMKFAIGRSVETFFKTPGRISWIDRGRNNFMKSVLPGETEADPADVEAVLPRYLAQQYGVPFRNGPKGPEFLLLGSWLPTGELQQMVDALTGGGRGFGGSAASVANYVGAKLHPAIKTGIEMAFNHSFYRDKEAADFPGDSEEFMGMAISSRWAATFVQNFRFITELDRNNLLGVSESLSLKHGASTEDPSYISRLAHSVFGFLPKTYPQSVEQAVRIKKRETMQELGRFAGILKNRAAHPEKVTSAEDADVLRTLIKQGTAQIARMEAVSASFPEDAPAVKKKRRKFGPLTESLTPKR